MRKLIPVLLLSVVLLAGCGAKETTKTGLGQVVSIKKSVSATAEKPGAAQVDTVMAAVTVDSKGKITAVSIDSAQVKVAFDATGAITTDLKAPLATKKELGDKYPMKAASKIGKGWHEQIAELEKWMIGKTIDEVKAMKTKQVDASHPKVPDVPELTSKVTITVEDYIAAVEEAIKNAK